jgi:hypothetical protein
MVAQIALPGRGDEARKWLGNRLHMAAPEGARGYLRGHPRPGNASFSLPGFVSEAVQAIECIDTAIQL